ncbi:MAG: hypothetical protein ABIG11_02715 [bacterium]
MKTPFEGRVLSVKARIRLIRSFDRISTHQYQGYTLVMQGNVRGVERDFRIAVGPKAHERHQFRIGDRVSGIGVPVPDPGREWADFYRISGLKLAERGPGRNGESPNPDGGIAPPLEVYRANGHRRLDRGTWQAQCFRCPWGLEMVTEIIVDQWNQAGKEWRFETHCYGPKECLMYNPGKPYRVPGRKPGMVFIDDDVERTSSG